MVGLEGEGPEAARPVERAQQQVVLAEAHAGREALGRGGEAAFAERMERGHPNVTAPWGRVRFARELDLIANLDCVVSMDSLAMHMASLVATPVVSVWGATHPALGFLGYGCPPEGVVQLDLPCRPCSVYGQRRCKFGDYRCMRIPPQAVLDRVEECLSIRRAEEADC